MRANSRLAAGRRQVPEKTVLSLTSLTVGEKSRELENDQGKTVCQHGEVTGNAQHKRNDFRVAQIDSVTFMIAPPDRWGAWSPVQGGLALEQGLRHS